MKQVTHSPAPPPLRPKEEYLVPDLHPNGRWSYGFGDLEVGDQLRCPLKPNERPERARCRVSSAAVCWKQKNLAEQRAHIAFRTMARTQYVLLERVA
jgi:hypothetical protein